MCCIGVEIYLYDLCMCIYSMYGMLACMHAWACVAAREHQDTVGKDIYTYIYMDVLYVYVVVRCVLIRGDNAIAHG